MLNHSERQYRGPDPHGRSGQSVRMVTALPSRICPL